VLAPDTPDTIDTLDTLRMTFHVLTLFPDSFTSIFSQSIIGRAIKKGQIKIKFINPRDFTSDSYHTVDDKPYGGGAGMVMKVEPLVKALESLKPKPYTILLSASGKTYTQKTAQKLKAKSQIALICGHYEGVDARVEKYVDEIVSIGDYVLTGGEIPATVIIDSVTRLLPDVINKDSLATESFSSLSNSNPTLSLEAPQYTRPEDFRGVKIPKVLLSGNHKEIEKWRTEQSAKRTAKFKKASF